MAAISGINPGLAVTQSAAAQAKTHRTKKAKAKAYVPLEHTCRACKSPVPQYKNKPVIVDGMCRHCLSMFGGVSDMTGYSRGATNVDPEEALEKIERVKRDGFLLVLRDLSLGAPDGNTVSITAGDIFPCTPTNPELEPQDVATKENTWALFTLKLQVGPYSVTLLPHEFSSITLKSLLACREAGEINETFISSDDATGHFTPTPEIREQILETFGHLI